MNENWFDDDGYIHVDLKAPSVQKKNVTEYKPGREYMGILKYVVNDEKSTLNGMADVALLSIVM